MKDTSIVICGNKDTDLVYSLLEKILVDKSGKTKINLINDIDTEDLVPSIIIITGLNKVDDLKKKQALREFLASTKELIIANMSDGGVSDILVKEKEAKGFVFPAIINYADSIEVNIKGLDSSKKEAIAAVFQVGLYLGVDSQTIQKSLENSPL